MISDRAIIKAIDLHIGKPTALALKRRKCVFRQLPFRGTLAELEPSTLLL